MRIFLAGGTGVLGRRIAAHLTADGHAVTVMVRSPQRAAGLLPPGVTVVAADALDRAAVAAAVGRAAPDLVMHQLTDLSGGTSATNARLRVEGTRNLVDAALAAGVRRIVTQSIAWCCQPGPDPAVGWPAGAVNVVDDEPAPGTDWVPAFCAAVGAPAPAPGTGPRHPWARGAVNHRARDLGWVPRHPSWRTGF